MKFNYKKPFFKALDKNSFQALTSSYMSAEDLLILQEVSKKVKRTVSDYKSGKLDLEFICESVDEVALNSYPKLKQFVSDLSPSKRFIHYGDGGFIFDYKGGGEYEYIAIAGDFISFNAWGDIDLNNRNINTQVPLFYNDFYSKSEREEMLKSATFYCLSLLLFLQFGEVETKIINGKHRKRDKINDTKIVTNVPFPIKVVDSRYFTNIIRTTGFKVSGHFRMQPYGPGLKQHKLIWIDEFEKNGYARKADKPTRTGR